MTLSESWMVILLLVAVFFCSACATTPQPVSAATAKDLYFKAESSYYTLLNSQSKRKYRHNWLNCIEQFDRAYQTDADGPWAPAALYMKSKLYLELSRFSGKSADKRSAHTGFSDIIRKFPSSRYRYRAAEALRTRFEKEYDPVQELITEATPLPPPNAPPERPTPAPKPPAAPVTPAASPPPATQKPALPLLPDMGPQHLVTGLRHWSNPDYTRVVIDASGESPFTHHLLKKDPAHHKPQRLYIDLKQARLDRAMKKAVPIDDHLLKAVRAGQYNRNTVRVVIDIKSFKNYKIFSLKNPYRVVIDVWGATSTQTASKKKPAVQPLPPIPGQPPSDASAIARQLALGVSRIVIDPGHGGKDGGAPGFFKNTHEKDVVLAISKKLAKKLKKAIDCEVILTRSTDTFLTLEERTAIANTQNADLFISIHTNAHRSKQVHGIETYFLNLATDDDAILVAARENATSTKNISDLQSILNDLMKNAKIKESSRLAQDVQSMLISRLSKKYKTIKDKGVKQAPFYVLLGAQMPAILVETAFISNKRECQRLTSAQYQNDICDAIVAGVKRYISGITPETF